MILHKSQAEDNPIFTLFDEQERVAVYPTRYIKFLNDNNRPLTSRKQIAHVIKTHCAWLEKLPCFKSLRIDEILLIVNKDTIVEWINSQRLERISETTINNREALVKGMYEYLASYDAGKIRQNIPWQRGYYTKPPHRRLPRFLTSKQIIKLLLGFYHESQRVAAHFAYDTGLRVSELIRLKVKQLPRLSDYPDWYNYFPLVVEGSKAFNGNQFKHRETIVTKAVLARVQRYHQTFGYRFAKDWGMSDPEKPVFLNVHGKKLSDNSFYSGIKSAWRRQGGNPQDISPHRLRHSTGYSILKSELGNDMQDRLLILKGMYGHNQISTTEIYCSVPLVVLDSLNNDFRTELRFEEADQIYRLTYLPSHKVTSKRRHVHREQ